jgi:hypothetical protein
MHDLALLKEAGHQKAFINRRHRPRLIAQIFSGQQQGMTALPLALLK